MVGFVREWLGGRRCRLVMFGHVIYTCRLIGCESRLDWVSSASYNMSSGTLHPVPYHTTDMLFSATVCKAFTMISCSKLLLPLLWKQFLQLFIIYSLCNFDTNIFCVFYANDGAVHLMLLMMTFTSFLVRCLPFFCATCVLFLYKYVFYCCFISRLQLTQLNHNGSFNLFNRIVKIKICFVFVNICIII